MNISFQQMAAAYDKHKHLKNAAEELGMKWQTLYWHLQKNGHPVTGNKAQYGSHTDKFASKAEKDFMELVPSAIDMNSIKFQSKWDFEIYGVKVDVKASSLNSAGKGSAKRYAFSIKKQEMVADFIVAFGYKDGEISVLIPFIAGMFLNLQGDGIGEKYGTHKRKQRRFPLFPMRTRFEQARIHRGSRLAGDTCKHERKHILPSHGCL